MLSMTAPWFLIGKFLCLYALKANAGLYCESFPKTRKDFVGKRVQLSLGVMNVLEDSSRSHFN